MNFKNYMERVSRILQMSKAYLEKNLNNFQVITQKVLNRMGYP